MEGSLERVRCVVAGEVPDRVPLFDLLPNDAVLAHFNGGKPVACGDDVTALQAIARAVDATRHSFFSPTAEGIETLPDGRKRRVERWTVWTAPRTYSSSQEYAETKTRQLDELESSPSAAGNVTISDAYRAARRHRKMLGEDFYYLLNIAGPSLMGAYGEVGLEKFCHYLADCESVVVRALELVAESDCLLAQRLPEDDPFEMVFLGDDIAFKTGTMIRPTWLRRHYFPQLRRVIDAFHKRGKKVMFHSDGNLNSIMDDLVGCGIDVLNPIEVAAGMDLKDLHARYPSLVFAGGIDVSHLLPFGTVQQVKDAVTRAVEDAEGRILIGSSTEIHNSVPLENFLAMRETAMCFRF